jgi:hypothetical protein
VKALIIAAVASAALAGSAGLASAQYGDAVPIRPNYRGEPSCPSNYVIRGNACVSIYAGRGGYERSYRRERHRDYGYRPGYEGPLGGGRIGYR